MYFISRLYQSIKGVVAISGVTGSLIAIIYGALQSGGTIFIVGGSLCLANSLFNIVEIGKVNVDIRKQIKNLEASIAHFVEQNNRLETSVQLGQQNNEQQALENNRLKGLVNKSEKHINKLEKLQSKILSTKEDLDKEVSRLNTENQTLLGSIDHLKALQQQYTAENNQLRATVEELGAQVKLVEGIKDQMVAENQALHVNNEQLEIQINKQAQIIVDSKSLIQNLAQFGDRYTAFQETLGNDIDRLEGTTTGLDNTAGVLQKLVNKLKNQTFDKLDINNDGIITRGEFHDGLDTL